MHGMLRKPQTADEYLKWISIGSIVVVVIALGVFVWHDSQGALQPKSVTQKPQGKSIKELDRNHVTDITGIAYDSNPPTSGTHFPVWAKRGVYNEVLSDGYLIHSLEHGYINISYNCGPKAPEVGKGFAYKQGSPLTKLDTKVAAAAQPLTPETEPPVEVKLPPEFTSAACKGLVEKLSMFLKEYQRVVIVPRVNLDTEIALTAWGRIDKMNTFDENRIRAFIDAYHNKGPEQTVE